MNEIMFLDAWFFAIGLLVLAVVLFRLARWARRSTRSALLFGLLAGFGMVPDPLYEKQLRMVSEAEDREAGDEESGDPPVDDSDPTDLL
jgi:hypothetical protein